MSGSPTWEVLSQIAAVVVGAFLIWWRIEARVNEARREAGLKADAAATLAQLIERQLAEHKLHVAETYITKAGLRESTEQLVTGMNGILERVDRLNERLDRVIESRETAKPRRPP
ncbi:MAG TPA: hypothetical protein VFT89_07270 [Rhizobiaceae bacterium]|nr:hypothetical protein [Rhizobiaceae bacterium]